jgi:hypothetical protein
MSNFLRPKITPTLDARGNLGVIVEWLSVDADQNIVKDETGRPLIAYREEVKQMPAASYVSHVGCAEAECSELTFFLDDKGRRHFVARAEFENMQVFGQDAQLTPRKSLHA